MIRKCVIWKEVSIPIVIVMMWKKRPHFVGEGTMGTEEIREIFVIKNILHLFLRTHPGNGIFFEGHPFQKALRVIQSPEKTTCKKHVNGL